MATARNAKPKTEVLVSRTEAARICETTPAAIKYQEIHGHLPVAERRGGYYIYYRLADVEKVKSRIGNNYTPRIEREIP